MVAQSRHQKPAASSNPFASKYLKRLEEVQLLLNHVEEKITEFDGSLLPLNRPVKAYYAQLDSHLEQNNTRGTKLVEESEEQLR